MSNILFVKVKSQYDAMGNYVDEIARAFQRLGHCVNIIDLMDKNAAQKMYALAGKIDILFSFNATLVEMQQIKQLFRGAEFVTYLCDHPLFHKSRIDQIGNDYVVFTCDQRHEQYIRHYYPNIKNVFFIPLSGSVAEKKIPYKEQTIEVVFTGSYQKPEMVMERLESKFQGSLYQFAMDMKQSIVSDPTQDLEQCLKGTLNRFGIEVSDAEFAELAYEYRDIDQYARVYYRDRMIRSLTENGRSIHVYGNGWNEFEGEGKEYLIIENGDSKAALDAVADAKISINIMPWFKAGFQERIATAMLSGTISVTDSSSYIEEHFQDGRELVLYDLQNLNALPEKINWLLSHEDEAEKIAKAGEKVAENSLTWQCRTEEMLSNINLNDYRKML